MFWQSSYFIWSFLCLLTLDQFASSGILCGPGQKATLSRTKCEPCPPGQYNPKSSDSNECHNCEPCGDYSLQISPCTSKSNTKCRCFEGFKALDKRRCKCFPGSGIRILENGKMICEKRRPNTSTSTPDSKCNLISTERSVQSKETFPGNATSDVNHRNEAKSVGLTSSHLPFSQTSTSTSAMTPTTSRNSDSTPTTAIPETQNLSKHAIWLAFLAAFVLLILILKFIRCPEKNDKDMERQGSTYRKPVEESGGKPFLQTNPHFYTPVPNVALSYIQQ